MEGHWFQSPCLTHPALGPEGTQEGECESLSQREKPGLDLEGELGPLYRGGGQSPVARRAWQMGGPSKLRGPTPVEDASETVPRMETAANANRPLITC